MTVSNGDILKVTFEVTLEDGSIAQNVHYFEAQFVATFSDITVRAEIKAWLERAYGDLTVELLASMTQNLCPIHQIEWDSGEGKWLVTRFLQYVNPSITFNNAQEGLPNQSSAFATFNTDRPKSFGRKFLMPFGEDQQAGTYLVSTALADMVDFADRVLTSILMAPLSNLVPGVPRAAADLFLPFVGAVVTNVLGTQRRRRPGVGA